MERIRQIESFIHSDFVQDKFKKKIGKDAFLDDICTFISLSDTLSDFKEYYTLEGKEDFSIYNYYAYAKKLGLKETDAKFKDHFLKEGYFFHVTPTSNLESILENGLVCLNDTLGDDMYEDILEVNKCWHEVARVNAWNVSNDTLIHIPNYDSFYKERLHSVYFGLNITELIQLYGSNSELTDDFVNNLLSACDRHVLLSRYSKDTVREIVVEAVENSDFTVSDRARNCLLSFFDKYYKEGANGVYKQKSIIMIPTSSVKGAISIEDSLNFYKLYKSNWNDIEYTSNISNEGLLGLTIDEDHEKPLNLHYKVKTKK